MDTTPRPLHTEEPASGEPAIAGDGHDATLDAIAAMDPADAPEPAERLAGALAHELEGVGGDAEPEQLAAPFPGDAKEHP